MTASESADQQAQLITEEWMTMNQPSSSKVVPLTFLEIMFLRETEDYVYTNVFPTLLTQMHAKYIRPFAHQIMVLLQQQQQKLNHVEESNDAHELNESICQNHAVLFGTMIRQRIHRLKTLVQHYVRKCVLPILIRIVTRMNTVINTNRNYRLEIIYVLRYVLDRYTLIQYNCTLIEMLYGGGNMMRKKVRMVSPPPGSHNQGIRHHSASSVTQLLPLKKNDQIRTALLTTVLGYLYEKTKQFHNHPRHDPSVSRSNSITQKILQLYVSIYQICNQIYYPYQYLIGTSYYMNLPNRLLQQILLLQQRPQQPLPTTTTTTRIASSTSVSSTWYVTMLRTSGVLLLSGCYITQMIQYYRQRRRTMRQEQLLERQQQQQQQQQSTPSGRPNHSISVMMMTTTGDANHPHKNHHEKRNDGHDEYPAYHDETTLLLQQQQLLLSSSEAEILPVPLLPKNDIHIPKGCCPICQQAIHRGTTTTPLSNHVSVTNTDALANTTMLYGYVYCSYTCIYQYLLEHDGICPMTGRCVPIMADRPLPQLIRLL